MKKTVLIIFSALVICVSFYLSLDVRHTVAQTCAQADCREYEEFSLSLLHPQIEKAIENFYGYKRRYEIGDSKLKILERKGNVFVVEAEVDTFEGAHNDYFTEIMIFTVSPVSVELESFSHCLFVK